MRTWTNIALFAVFALGSVLTVQISPKLDFDSYEQSPDSFSNDSDPLAIGESNDSDSSPRDSRGASARIRITYTPSVSAPAPRKSPRNIPSLPNGIKNVYVVVNDQGITISGPGRIDCKENVCHMLITDTNSMGNIVSAIQLTVVAKVSRIKVDDIPIIDGVRGTVYDRFPYNNARDSRFRYKVPQPTGVYQQTIRRPKSTQAPFTRNYGDWNRMIPDTSPVDDKIAPPLSNTNYEDQGPI